MATDYGPEDWERLGRVIKRGRLDQGHHDMGRWAHLVGRSSPGIVCTVHRHRGQRR